MQRSGDAPVSRGALAAACSTCGGSLPVDELSNPDISMECSRCQAVEPKKMGRPRKRSIVPVHRVAGRGGYVNDKCGCVECTEANRQYMEDYNNRKRLEARINAVIDSESAA